MSVTEAVMGMPVTINLVGVGGKMAAAAFAAGFARLHEIDEIFSTYKPGSVISRINRGVLKAAEAPTEVRVVLEACAAMKRRTHGYFDIWHRGKMDPSGFVKGWAIAEVGRLLEARGIERYCVEAGGDVAVAGANREGEAWRVGIRHPSRREQIVKVVALGTGAVATSGTYERGDHIYNPHTGGVADGLVSLTVVGPSILEADVYATAAFAMGPDRGLEFIAAQGLEGYQIDRQEAARFTPGLGRFVV